MDTADQLAIAHSFAAAAAVMDADALRQICTDDVAWTVPGNSSIGGATNASSDVAMFTGYLA